MDVIQTIKDAAIELFFVLLNNLNLGYYSEYLSILYKIAFIQSYEQLIDSNNVAQKLLS